MNTYKHTPRVGTSRPDDLSPDVGTADSGICNDAIACESRFHAPKGAL